MCAMASPRSAVSPDSPAPDYIGYGFMQATAVRMTCANSHHLHNNPGDLQERLQFLVGISSVKLIKLLWRHRFRVQPCHWRSLGQLLFLSLLASACNTGDTLRLARRTHRAKIAAPPVFI